MNGKLEGFAFARKLTALAEEVNSPVEYTIGDMRYVVNNLMGDLTTMANTDLRECTLEVLRIHGVNAKIAAIKAIRAETGLGLKESKEAVEKYAPEVARELATAALRDLEAVNRTAGWADAAYLDNSHVENVGGFG